VIKLILESLHKDIHISLNLSKNHLGLKGAHLIAPVLSSCNRLHSLDISETNLGDDGLHLICEALFNNDSITHLNISNNFSFKNTKTRHDLIESMSHMVLSNTLPLEVLHMAGTASKNRLRENIVPFLLNFKKNNKLEELDISGHAMGNKGAIALSKILTVNHSLKKLSWDENTVGILGYWNFNDCLKHNTTLRDVSVPYQDIVGLYSDSRCDKVELAKILAKIEKKLSRNQKM